MTGNVCLVTIMCSLTVYMELTEVRRQLQGFLIGARTFKILKVILKVTNWYICKHSAALCYTLKKSSVQIHMKCISLLMNNREKSTKQGLVNTNCYNIEVD